MNGEVVSKKEREQIGMVVKADLSDSSQLVDPFRGCDAVLSAVGAKAGLFVPCDVYTSIGKAAVAAMMREVGIKRFVFVTAWGTKDDHKLPYLLRWVFKPTFLRNVLKNMEEFEDYLSNDCADINYTVVRPSRLMDIPTYSQDAVVSVGRVVVVDYSKDYISRHDVAKFMLSCLTRDHFDHEMVAITTRRGRGFFDLKC